MPSRATGWIQDPGRLENLIKTVEVFDHTTNTHQNLLTDLPSKVLVKDGRNNFIQQLNSRNGYNGHPKISYKTLVGTGFKPRSAARCNGIVQALIPGQRRPFISDWPANNFIRWAETLGFIQYYVVDDAYSITDFGLRLSQANTISNKFDILELAFLQYPPAIRILELLSEHYNQNPQNPLLTKFELGSELGFRGEDGFTTYPQHLIIQVISMRPSDKNKILTDWEGSSDKYARMICGWLSHSRIKWVAKQTKNVSVAISGNTYMSNIPQSYKITPDGIQALRTSRARSRHANVPKRVPFEMLATKGADIAYLRTRRSLVIQYLNSWKAVGQIIQYLNNQGFINIPPAAVVHEVNNLKRIGLDVRKNTQSQFRIADNIIGLTIPTIVSPQLIPSQVTQIKLTLSNYIKYINHSYFDLIDLGFDGQQNKLYELRVVALINLISNFTAQHLPGPNRPEIIAYYPDINPQSGVITDCKAYATGFSLPNNERDKMVRYIDEYKVKNPSLNPNKWWENFKSPNYPNDIKYCFVSGNFTGQYQNQLNYINLKTSINGGAITSKALIERVDAILDPSKTYSVASLINELNNNTLVS